MKWTPFCFVLQHLYKLVVMYRRGWGDKICSITISRTIMSIHTTPLNVVAPARTN
jgi:hypothetical protein